MRLSRINPQLRHPVPADNGGGERRTVIEFPAYANQIESLARTLRDYGLDARAFSASPMLQSLTA